MRYKTNLLMVIFMVAMVISVVMGSVVTTSATASEEEYWHVIEGILFDPKPWSHPTTLHIPTQAERNSWITLGKFVEYTGSEKWRWTITNAKESEATIGLRRKPTFAVTLSFKPYYPEPPSAIASRSVNEGKESLSGLVITGCFYWPYLTPTMLRALKSSATEKLSTPLGVLECYKLGYRQPANKLLPKALFAFVSSVIDNFTYWYDVKIGVLVKGKVKTDKGEVLNFTINKTNIEGLVPERSERLVLEDIVPQLSGPASRVMVMESSDETYPYVVKDAGLAAYRFNAVKGPKRHTGATITYPSDYEVTVHLHGEWANITGKTGRCILEAPGYKAEYELYSQHGGYVISWASGQEAVIGRGLVAHVKGLEDVEKIFLLISDYIRFMPVLWTEGSEHIIMGNVQFSNHQATGDYAYPLVFKMVKDLGYAYLCGRGTVTTKDGKTYRLGYEDTVNTWLPRLKPGDQLDREGAAQALGWLAKMKEDKDKAAPALIEALTDEAMEVRRDAAEALGRIGDPHAIDALNKALKEDKDDWVREVAEESIGLIEMREAAAKLANGDKTTIADLTKGLKHKWVLVRRTAAEFLVKGGTEAVEPLIAALKDVDAEVQMNAAKALGEIGDERALEPLREKLAEEKDKKVKNVFEATIKKLEK